jgi:hypothetical protein
MKTIKCIIADDFKMDFHKVKKDFVVYLQPKKYRLLSSLGTKLPKLGVKFAKLTEDGKVEFWERVSKSKSGQNFALLGTYSYTQIEKYSTFLICFKQKYAHRDILQDKKQCSVFYEDGTSQIVSGVVLVNHLFNGSPLPSNCEIEAVKQEATVITEPKSLLETPDWELTGEQLWEKQRMEIQMGICPF